MSLTKVAHTLPVLAHIHVPKCGGTSLARLLSKHFGPKHLELYCGQDTYFVYTEDTLSKYLNNASVVAFSSHFVRTFPDKVARREMLYVTFLRNPVEQFVSYLTYVRKHFDYIRQHYPDLLSGLPPNLLEISLRRAAKWILTSEQDINFRDNYTVNFFARFPYRELVIGTVNEAQYRSARFEIAKQVLERFFFVGITERMDQSASELRRMTLEIAFPFPEEDVSIENTSHDDRDDVSWVSMDDEVGRLLHESVREDKRLYNLFSQRQESKYDVVAP